MKVGKEVRFSTVPEWLIFSDVSAYAVRVWAVLDRKADSETGECEISIARVAKLSRCSRNTVKKALRELEDIGAVDVSRGRRSESGDPDMNSYVLLTSDPSRRDRGRSRDDLPGGSRDDRQVGHDVTEGVGHEVATKDLESNNLESPKEPQVLSRRKADPLWDALADIFEPQTATERSLVGKAKRELAAVGATPEQVRARATEAWHRWQRPFSPAALTKHWSSLRQTHHGSSIAGSFARYKQLYGTEVQSA